MNSFWKIGVKTESWGTTLLTGKKEVTLSTTGDTELYERKISKN